MPKSRIWVSNTEAVLCIMGMMIIIGIVNIFSASFVKAGVEFDNTYYFLNRHLMWLAIGFIGMVVAIKMNYKYWRLINPFLIMLTFVALLLVAFMGIEINGSRRWLNIGIQFQPSEIAKLAVLVMVASYLGPLIDKKVKVTLWNLPMALILGMSALVYKQPDLGTAAIIFALAFFMHILAGMQKEDSFVLVAGALGLAVLLTFSASYRIERVWAWLDPWAYQQTQGYQTVQSMIAIGSGGLFGTGLGVGTSKFFYLPEAHTDFAFAIFCQEAGFIGATIILFLLAGLAIYGGKIAHQVQDGYGKMLVVGVTMLIVGQGVANIAMVSGMLPVIGVPLPFISYGGTSLVVNMVSIGILINVGRQVKRKKAPTPDGGERASKNDRSMRLLKKGA